MRIELNLWEMRACIDEAALRMAVSADKNANHANVRERDYFTRLTDEIVGSASEMAVCKAIKATWTPSINSKSKEPDIVPNIGVRSTVNENGSLILRPQDPDNYYFFLVTGTPPAINVIGYIKCAEGKRDEWWRDPNGHGGAWFVPQEALRKVKVP